MEKYDARAIYFEKVRKAKERAKGGQIGKIECVDREPDREPNIFVPSDEIKVDKRKDIRNATGSEKTQFPYQRNQNLIGKVRKAGLEQCVVDNAKLTSNKSEIGRRCGCDRRTVYRILVEEGKEEEREDNRCPQCEAYGSIEINEDGIEQCTECGFEI